MPATPACSPRRSAISVQLMTQFGLDHGMTLEQCLGRTGLDIGVLADPGAEVEATQELELLRNINRHIGQRPGIGLKAGLRYHLNATASGASRCSAARPSSVPRTWACATST